jgi:hypothetical protein
MWTVTDAQVLTRISTRSPRSVNVTTACADVSPQYELLGERQRTLDGKWEPPRYRQRPESPERGSDELTGELFDVGRRPTLRTTRPKGGLERLVNSDCSPPLGDVDAAPATSRFVRAQQLSAVLDRESEKATGDLARRLHNAGEALARCGTKALAGEGTVDVRSDGKSRHFSGLAYCGRALCPNCGPFSAARRREALEALVPLVLATGGRSFHVVLTLRHHMGVRWLDLASAVKGVFRKMRQCRTWGDSVAGFVRSDETTFGRNGHHFHSHLLVTLKPGVDADALKAWIEDYWQVRAREHGRTSDWHDGWWSEVAPVDLLAVVRYGTKQAAHEPSQTLAHVLAGEVLGGASKRGSAPWDLPPVAYAEVWHDSKGYRWFGAGGCWKSDQVKAVESEEGAAEARETHGEVIGSVPREDWRRLPRELRRWVRGLAANRALTDADFLRSWNWLWTHFDPATGRVVLVDSS